MIRRRIVQAHLRLTGQDKGVGTTQVEIKMQAHFWILPKVLPPSVTILLICAVEEKGGLRLIPQKRDREGVRRPGRINGDEPEKQFLAQAAKDLLPSRSLVCFFAVNKCPFLNAGKAALSITGTRS